MVMYRFVTCLWDERDAQASGVAERIARQLRRVSPHDWSGVLQTDSVLILHADEQIDRMQAYRIQNGGGVVLGKVFRSDFSSQKSEFCKESSRAIVESGAQYLVDNYWGRYVAFLTDKDRGIQHIFRDPSGAFPCFFTDYHGVQIYFSDMQDIANLDFLDFTINWEYQKTNITLPQYQKIHTGLNEVSEVLPAERRSIGQSGVENRFLWDPKKVSEHDVVDDVDEAIVLLRTAVSKSIAALAGCYESVVHNLGGLDSSIALACMAKTANRPTIHCITNFTESPSGDERVYSRQVAKMYDVPLAESKLDFRKADLTRVLRANKLVNPLGFLDCIDLTGDLLALAKEKQAQALFYGVGGDQVFFQPPTNLGALDYVRRHGLLNFNTPKIAMEASRYGRVSLFATLRAMMQEKIAPPVCFSAARYVLYQDFTASLVNPEFIGEGAHEEFLHPLIVPEKTDPKGKYLHMSTSALFPLDYYNHWDTEYFAERIFVFQAQPIVEACLRIPVWILTLGGVDRGLARTAFRGDLPDMVLRRYTKSSPTEFNNDICDNNIDILKEYLLDGEMVKEGILVREKLESALTRGNPLLNVVKFQVLNYFATEVWIRGWKERKTQKTPQLMRAV